MMQGREGVNLVPEGTSGVGSGAPDRSTNNPHRRAGCTGQAGAGAPPRAGLAEAGCLVLPPRLLLSQ